MIYKNNEENNFNQIKNNKINLKNEYKSHQLCKLSEIYNEKENINISNEKKEIILKKNIYL